MPCCCDQKFNLTQALPDIPRTENECYGCNNAPEQYRLVVGDVEQGPVTYFDDYAIYGGEYILSHTGHTSGDYKCHWYGGSVTGTCRAYITPSPLATPPTIQFYDDDSGDYGAAIDIEDDLGLLGAVNPPFLNQSGMVRWRLAANSTTPGFIVQAYMTYTVEAPFAPTSTILSAAAQYVTQPSANSQYFNCSGQTIFHLSSQCRLFDFPDTVTVEPVTE